MLDVIITDATIVDGTGKAPYQGHVGIHQDEIVGPWQGTQPLASRVFSAAGKILTPGFIDVHSHADLIHPLPQERRKELLLGRLAQGITTEIIGNCGLGACPIFGEARALLKQLNSWMSPPDCSWDWDSVPAYLEALSSASPLCNVGLLAPHGPLRVCAMGLASGEPDPSQAAQMAGWLEEALNAGVFGLSTGLIYPPGMYSSTDELRSLARIVARHGGIYASHIRGSSETLLESVDELLMIGKNAEVAVHHSHNEAVGRAHWWKIDQVLEREEKAAAEGVAISFDMFPYPAAATMMVAIYPPWSLEGGVEKLLERLRDPRMRRLIEKDIAQLSPLWPPWLPGRWPHNLVRAVGWENIYIGSCTRPENKEFEHLSLQELGRRTGKSPFDAISDLMIADEGKVSQIIFQVSGTPEDESKLETLIAHPLGILATDANDYGKGKPHPAAYGAFPRILSRFIRQKGVCSPAEAIRKMTARPAELFGINRRGLIREGYFADLIVLDYQQVEDRATFDQPRTLAEGIEKVFINGTLVLDGGRWVSHGAGRLLRHS